jgi:hypothetical protein
VNYTTKSEGADGKSRYRGNMYDWVGPRWNPEGGSCPHDCIYCSTKFCVWTRDNPKYQGLPRIIESEMTKKLSSPDGKPIFVVAQNDLFAKGIPENHIDRILKRCKAFPENTYIFQTKNPGRIPIFLDDFPESYMIGTTIETDRKTPSKAPSTTERATVMRYLSYREIKTFITIEPIMKFNFDFMLGLLISSEPSFVNIGADSKNCHLPEPTYEEAEHLISCLKKAGIEVRIKSNLDRLRLEATV